MASLLPHELTANTSGWGPLEGEPDPLFGDIPFAPFSKDTPLGQIADTWSNSQPRHNRQHASRTSVAPKNPKEQITTAFNEFADEQAEAFSFSTVDSRPTTHRRQTFQRNRPVYVKQRVVGGRNWQAKKGVTKKAKKRKFKRVQWTNWAARNRKFESSIEVDPAWGEPLDVIAFETMKPLTLQAPTGTTLESHGELELFNDSYSRLTARQEKSLERKWVVDRKFYQITTSDDPVLTRLAKENTGNIYVTDMILGVLMTTLRSKYSWDIVVKKVGNDIFFDKRENSRLDYLSVNENSTNPPFVAVILMDMHGFFRKFETNA